LLCVTYKYGLKSRAAQGRIDNEACLDASK
jgi:hypothetical protein